MGFLESHEVARRFLPKEQVVSGKPDCARSHWKPPIIRLRVRPRHWHRRRRKLEETDHFLAQRLDDRQHSD
jgi:hypothetical protein